MNLLAVDDEHLALNDLRESIEAALPDNILFCCDKSADALEYAKNNRIDVAFLDINIGGINGLQLAKHLKDIHGETNIVFVTGYTQYAVDAFSIHASGFVMKPVSVPAIKTAIENLRNPVTIENKQLRVQCFGNFEVFSGSQPLRFSRSKTKELFAYLISREGAQCSTNEIIATLWENSEDTHTIRGQFRTLVHDLKKTLKSVSMEDVLLRHHNYLAVMPDRISCDLYDFLKNKNINNYKGEFMAQYSWAEDLNAYLNRSANKF